MSTKIADAVPEAPNFDTTAADVIAHADEYANFAVGPTPNQPTSKDPLVVAAEEYSMACRLHMSAQGAVARAKQALEDAKADEDRSYKERVAAQAKLSELVMKTTEAVL